MDDSKRLELIAEAVWYCQRAAAMGMPPSCYTKALREPIYFLWTCRSGRNKAARAQFRSKAAIGLIYGKGKLIFDHAVPFKYLQAELLKLSEISTDSVRLVLDSFPSAGVLITKEENQRLNEAGLQSAMPPNWNGADPFARYKAVGIEIVQNLSASG
jgi:hypothetical protein